MSNLKLGTSIRWKFMAIVISILAVSSIVSTFLLARRQQAILRESLLDKGQSLGAYMAKLSWEPLLTNETTQLDGIVSEANKEADVVLPIGR